MRTEGVHKILSSMFIASACFPFLDVFGFNSDVQPNTVILALIICVLYFPKLVQGGVSKKLLQFSIFAILILLFSWRWNFFSIRIVVGLISVIVNVFIFQNFVIKKDINWIVKFSLHIYFIGGLLEYMGFNLGSLVGRNYERILVGGRGLSSFAPEPSFYGIMVLLFLIYLNSVPYDRKVSRTYLIAIGAIQICLMARSGLGILLFLLLLLSNITLRKSLLAMAFIGAIVILFTQSFTLSESRPAQLLGMFLNNGFQIVMLDGSMNLRLSDIIYSHISVFKAPMGHGTLPWNEYLEQLETGNFLKSKQGRVMSFTGSFIYRFGFISLLFFSFLKERLSERARSFKSRRFSWILFIALGVNAISITLPLLHMLIAKEDEGLSR